MMEHGMPICIQSPGAEISILLNIWCASLHRSCIKLLISVKTVVDYIICNWGWNFQAVLEKQSYMLIGRHDIERLMRLDPASACLRNSQDEDYVPSDVDSVEIESQLSDLLWNLRPIKQVFRLFQSHILWLFCHTRLLCAFIRASWKCAIISEYIYFACSSNPYHC